MNCVGRLRPGDIIGPSEPMASPTTNPNTAWVRVLYWKEVPVQVQAEDESGRVSVMLDPRFQEAADAIAMFEGSYGSDDYLEGWQWSEPREVDSTARGAAADLSDRYNSGMPDDFVARIRDLDGRGLRDPSPGAIDGWLA